MILLLFLFYVISLVTVLQFSYPGTIAEEGEWVECKARFLEGWTMSKIVVVPEYVTWF